MAAEDSAEYSKRHFRFLAIVTAFIPLAYVVDVVVGRPYFDTLAIRTTAFIAATPFLFHEKLRWTRVPLHIAFVAVVTYALPTVYGWMLVLNAASAPSGSEIEMLWILQYVISLFLFIQMIHNGYLATFLWLISTGIVLSPLIFLDSVNWTELRRVMLYPITGYLTALFFGILTNRNVDYVNSEKLKAASAIGVNIAHELRTPLASIRSLARALNNHSVTLVDTYHHAREAGLHSGELNMAQIEGLKSALSSIEKEVVYSNTIIDMLLLNTSERLEDRDAAIISAQSCVNEAVDRYPFNSSRERRLLSVSIRSDFQIRGSRILVVHVLFNLLKNGIYYSQKSPNGRVQIIVGTHESRTIEITDTGPGVPPSSRRFIFDRFYSASSTSQGAGIGLSFCKTVMQAMGGHIEFDARDDGHTTFRLIFPPLKSNTFGKR